MFAGNFAPSGWMLCQGQTLAISQYETLFNLIGTTYGGDGVTTFGLPDLRGRVPLHRGTDYALGQTGGVEAVTLSVAQLPSHTHTVQVATAAGDHAVPAPGDALGQGRSALYKAPEQLTNLSGAAVAAAGGGQPHDNMQPFLVFNFCIALLGDFPFPA